MNNILENREVIFEFTQIGNYMKVSAMDVSSLTEINIQCPIGISELMMKRNALKRLEYVLKKKNII